VKILFLGLTKAQYIYFKKLNRNLNCTSKVIFFPSIFISFRALKVLKKINIKSALNIKFFEVDIKYKNRFHNILYKIFLRFEAIWFLMSIYFYLEKYKPEFLALWNGKKFHQRLALEVAELFNIKPLFFENGVMPNTTTLDLKGVNASSSIPRDIEFFKKLKYSKINLPTTLIERKSKKKRVEIGEKLPSRYIFVPFQVSYDTQILQHSPWIGSMFELFDIIEWLSERLDIAFVIKEHPSDRVSNYKSLYARRGEKIFFSLENTQKLIQNATAVVTINSSVAVEALLFYKRVVVLGEAFFAIDGLVKVAKSEEELLSILQNIDSFKIKKDLVNNFLAYLYYDYLIPDSWKNPTKRHFKAIEERVKC